MEFLIYRIVIPTVTIVVLLYVYFYAAGNINVKSKNKEKYIQWQAKHGKKIKNRVLILMFVLIVFYCMSYF